MKKFIVSENSKNKLFEIFYHTITDKAEGTASVKVVAKDIIEAVEILTQLVSIDVADIEYATKLECERIIA